MTPGDTAKRCDNPVIGGDISVTPAVTILSPPSLLYKYSRFRALTGFCEAAGRRIMERTT
jgi:hypothetical protein